MFIEKVKDANTQWLYKWRDDFKRIVIEFFEKNNLDISELQFFNGHYEYAETWNPHRFAFQFKGYYFKLDPAQIPRIHYIPFLKEILALPTDEIYSEFRKIVNDKRYREEMDKLQVRNPNITERVRRSGGDEDKCTGDYSWNID